MKKFKPWSGHPWPEDPDNFWIDDDTGELVDAHTGKRKLNPNDPHLVEARRIALLESKQTGINAKKFLDGTNDTGFGVRAALAGIRRGLELAKTQPK